MTEGPAKRYLGDAVYAADHGNGMIVLTTEDGYQATNTIYLEPEVFAELLRFHAEMSQK